MSIPRRSFFTALFGTAAATQVPTTPVPANVVYALNYPLCCGTRMVCTVQIDIPSEDKVEFYCKTCQRKELACIWVPVQGNG
jgi:hypothetical protein